MPEFLLSLRQREAEPNTAELADIGDGVSASLSGPELELGDGGGREEETEGCKRSDSKCEVSSLPAGGVFILWFAQAVCMFTCNEILDLLVFSLTLARAPLSPEDFSVISRAALSSLGVSALTGAAGA